MNQAEKRYDLIRRLLAERQDNGQIRIPANAEEQRRLLRALLNVRPPQSADQAFLAEQDAYLQQELREKGITDSGDLKPILPGIYLRQGDITALRCDAIVNAANSALLGCFCPNHGCIDNAIHTFSGIQLRLACAELMEAQGHGEPVGRAKITPAFNLPCKYVIHTVGPAISGRLTKRDCELLASCYRSCLTLAEAYDIKSIAFPCISTGEFCFPQKIAAEIAVHTVQDYHKETNSGIEVIFDVWKDEDAEIYRRLLGGNTKAEKCTPER